MESSSDDSFAWTNASSDTADSDTMDVHNNKNQSDIESEFGNSFKKKLQKDLFSNNEEKEVTDEALPLKNRKRKGRSVQTDDESIGSSKKKKIKVEPESDLENYNNNINISNYEPQLTSNDESYLNMRVKQEENFATPTPVKSKKKKHKTNCDTYSANESESDYSRVNDNSVNVYQAINEPSDIRHSLDSEETQIKVKKKKKKSKKRRGSSESDVKDDSTIIDNKFTAEETVVNMHQVNGKGLTVSEETIKKDKKFGHKKKYLNNADRKVSSSDESTSMKEHEGEIMLKRKSFENDSCPVESTRNKVHTPVDSPDTLVLDVSNIREKTNQRVSRISERIRFEEEHDTDLDVTENNDKEIVKNTRKFKNFLKSHPDLKPVMQQLPTGTTLTQDEEIWMIRSPHDIDVNMFQGLNLNLDKKSKFKLGEQTYESNINKEPGRIPVLSVEHKELVLKNLLLIGTLNLRKRIPKAHILDDNIMTNNQDFIPLPETKCRHPLFGSNYKRSMKIPKAVAERLNVEANDEPLSPQSERSKKKKHKKGRRKSEDIALESTVTPKYETEPEEALELIESKKKKSKKRKHEHHEESPPTKKSKRVKYEQGSSEVWESEKAIEESLFNF